MIKKIYFTLAILAIVSGTSLGQSDLREGYVITNENDTIRGLVDYRSNAKNYESCFFRGPQGDKEYFPDQIFGFRYTNDKFFRSSIVEGTFVEVLVEGPISLYKSKVQYHIVKDTAFHTLDFSVEKVEHDGKTGLREDYKWRGLLTYLVSDCMEISPNMAANMRYDEKAITRLIVKYNECTGEKYDEFKNTKPWTKVEVGLAGGLVQSRIPVSYDSDGYEYMDDSYESLDPSIGILLAISSPRVSEQLFFQAEFHYFESSYTSLKEVSEYTLEYFDTYIDLSTLSIPVSFKYAFNERVIGTYVQGGFNFDIHIKAETLVRGERVFGSNVITYPETEAFEVNKSQVGVWGGLGLYKTFNRLETSLAIRYSWVPGLSNSRALNADVNRISLNLIIFRK